MKGWTAGSAALLGLAAVLIAAHAGFAFSGREAFLRMWADFGVVLPLATEVALHPVTSPLLTALLAFGCTLAVLQPKERSVLLTAVIALGLLLAVVLLWAAYLPNSTSLYHLGAPIS